MAGIRMHMAGIVNASGGIVVSYGAGFKVNHSQVGIYHVTFNSGFSQPPVVTATSTGEHRIVAAVRLIDGNSAQIETIDPTDGSGKDCQFHFTVTSHE